MQDIEQHIIKGIKEGNREVFDLIYDHYYENLCSFSCSIVHDINRAEEVVQQIIFSIWEKRATLSFEPHLRSYLYTATYHNSIRYMQKLRRFNTESELSTIEAPACSNSQEILETAELREAIGEAIDKLPKNTKKVFQQSRDEGLSYKEIAEVNKITVKGVEYHISKALKFLRTELSQFITISILISLSQLGYLLFNIF